MTSIFLLAAALTYAEEVPREGQIAAERAAVETVQRDERVRGFVERYDDIEFQARFNERFRVWAVELIGAGRRLGFASVKDGEVVEIDLKERVASSARSLAELIEDHPRFRELQGRYSEASVELARNAEGERRAFEIVVGDREVAAGFVDVESGEVRFFDEIVKDNEENESREAGGFWWALWRVCRFPVEGNGLVWFAAIVTLLAVFPFPRVLRMQSLDVVVLLLVFPLSLVVWGQQFQTFLALFVLAGYLLIRCIWRGFHGGAGVEPPNLPAAVLAGLLVLVTAAHVQAVFTRGPDDSGIWTVFGGQYVWQQGRLPYGQIGEGGTYGPVLYALAAPLAHAIPPTATMGESGKRLVVTRHNIERVGYRNCDFLPAKIIALGFDSLLLVGLIAIGRQAAGWHVGLSLALVYAVNGLTIQRDLLFVSHLAPTACVVLAIAAHRLPALSGSLLALGAGILFWPAFLIPTWLAYYGGRGRGSLLRCGIAIAVIGATTLAAVHFYTEPVEGRGPLKVFVDSTWGHQEGGGPYSHSEFGLWGQWKARSPERAGEITKVKRMVRWSYLVLCLALPTVLYVCRKPIPTRALLGASAALALGLQFWKSHGGGLYTGWYLSLVVATLLTLEKDEQIDMNA